MFTSLVKPTGGFTIIEVLVVLAATAVVSIGALEFVSNYVGSNSITVATNDFVLALREAIQENTITYFSGYNTTFYCTSNGDGSDVQLSYNPPGPGGNNLGCIFLGQIIQFNPAGQPSQYIRYPLAGNQTYNGEEVQTLDEAAPVPIYSPVNFTQTDNVEDSLTVSKVTAVDDSNPGNPTPPSVTTSAIGFILGDLNHNLSTYDSGNNLNNGSLLLNMYYVNNSVSGQTSAQLVSDITGGATPDSSLSAASQVSICLDQHNGNSAAVTINGSVALDVSSKEYYGSSSC